MRCTLLEVWKEEGELKPRQAGFLVLGETATKQSKGTKGGAVRSKCQRANTNQNR